MARLEAIVFDLDGTLIHSAPDIQFATNAALAKIGRGPLDLAKVISFIGNGVETLVTHALEATGGTTPALERDTLAVLLAVYNDNITTLTRPYDGVVTALEQFRAKGLKLGICTNKLTTPAQVVCDQLDLSQYFDAIVGAEPDRAKKPQPQMLHRCLEMLGCAATNALYVGDSAVDFQTARNAMVPFRLFAGGYLNGPLPDVHPTERFDHWDTHGIIVT